MKIKLLTLSAFSLAALAACGDRPANNSASASPGPIASSTPVSAIAVPTAVPTTTPMKDGDYDGKGVVTKVDLKIGSVEMDHEEIKDLMPPMRMEFYVTDKKMLDPLKVGDRVEFVVRYKGGQETVVRIKKAE